MDFNLTMSTLWFGSGSGELDLDLDLDLNFLYTLRFSPGSLVHLGTVHSITLETIFTDVLIAARLVDTYGNIEGMATANLNW